MNGLASDAEGIPRPRVHYEQHLDKFKDDWKDEWGGKGYDLKEENDEKAHLIPNEICEKIKKLVDEHKGRLRPLDKIGLFFTTYLGYSNKKSIPDDHFKEWRDAKNFFDKHAHSRKKVFSIDASVKVKSHFQNLDNLLYAAAETDIKQLRSIHEILDEANR